MQSPKNSFISSSSTPFQKNMFDRFASSVHKTLQYTKLIPRIYRKSHPEEKFSKLLTKQFVFSDELWNLLRAVTLLLQSDVRESRNMITQKIVMICSLTNCTGTDMKKGVGPKRKIGV